MYNRVIVILLTPLPPPPPPGAVLSVLSETTLPAVRHPPLLPQQARPLPRPPRHHPHPASRRRRRRGRRRRGRGGRKRGGGGGRERRGDPLGAVGAGEPQSSLRRQGGPLWRHPRQLQGRADVSRLTLASGVTCAELRDRVDVSLAPGVTCI